MIEANELRIGNYLCFLFKYEELITKKVTQLTAKQIYRISEMNDADDFWEPIPLTPEILEKCGFDMKPDWHDNKKDGSIAFMDLGWLNISMNSLGGVTLFDNDGRSTGTNINHLHQLQNLYYALTNEELKINLEQVK